MTSRELTPDDLDTAFKQAISSCDQWQTVIKTAYHDSKDDLLKRVNKANSTQFRVCHDWVCYLTSTVDDGDSSQYLAATTFANTLYTKLIPVDLSALIAKLKKNRTIGFQIKNEKFDVKFLSCFHRFTKEEPTNPEKALNNFFDRFMKTNEDAYMALTGSSGSGKTSLMRWMLNKMSNTDDEDEVVISVYVTSGYTRGSVSDVIIEKIKDQLNQIDPHMSRLIGTDEMSKIRLAVGIDEVKHEWRGSDYKKLSHYIKDHFKCVSVSVIVGGTDIAFEISSCDTNNEDVYKVRMVPMTEKGGKGSQLVAWHMHENDPHLSPEECQVYAETCEKNVRHFSALVTNHRCAMHLANALEKERHLANINPGHLHASSYFIIRGVADKHLTTNGFRMLNDIANATKRVLLDALALVATQPHLDVVDESNTDVVRLLLLAGIIERAVEKDCEGNIHTLNGFEWEMSPALVLLAAATLVPELLTPTDPSDRLEVLGALHVSLLRYAHTGKWKKVAWLDRPIPFATSAHELREPVKHEAMSVTLINGNKAPYADVISIESTGAVDEGRGESITFEPDENKPAMRFHIDGFERLLREQVARLGEVYTQLSLPMAMQIKSSGLLNPEFSVNVELNKMGLRLLEHGDGKKQEKLTKKFETAESLNKSMFNGQVIIACFLTNALFTKEQKQAMQPPADTLQSEVKWRTIIVQGGQLTDDTFEREKMDAWACMYPLVNIFSFEAQTKTTWGTTPTRVSRRKIEKDQKAAAAAKRATEEHATEESSGEKEDVVERNDDAANEGVPTSPSNQENKKRSADASGSNDINSQSHKRGKHN